MIENILLDFDGTLTDLEEESVGFLETWYNLFSEKTNFPRKDLLKIVNIYKQDILKDQKAGWENNGFIVAPANCDPYVLNTSIYQKIVGLKLYSTPNSKEKCDDLLYQIFLESHKKTKSNFLSGAKELIKYLDSNYDLKIVTNSKTETVIEKLESIGIKDVDVIGNAKKYEITNDIVDIDKYKILAYFPREI